MKAKLEVEDITAIIDTREQIPANLDKIKSERATLDTGDYSIKGLEPYVRIERKSLDDLLMCIGRERDRFERELVRLRGFHHKSVVVECYWSDIYEGKWRSQLTPKHVIGSLARWQLEGIPFILSGPRPKSCEMIQRLLYLSAKEYYNIARSFTR